MKIEEVVASIRKKGGCPNLTDDDLRGLIRLALGIIEGSPLLKGTQ